MSPTIHVTKCTKTKIQMYPNQMYYLTVPHCICTKMFIFSTVHVSKNEST